MNTKGKKKEMWQSSECTYAYDDCSPNTIMYSLLYGNLYNGQRKDVFFIIQFTEFTVYYNRIDQTLCDRFKTYN
jgi:hypothetical protein